MNCSDFSLKFCLDSMVRSSKNQAFGFYLDFLPWIALVFGDLGLVPLVLPSFCSAYSVSMGYSLVFGFSLLLALVCGSVVCFDFWGLFCSALQRFGCGRWFTLGFGVGGGVDSLVRCSDLRDGEEKEEWR